MNPLFPNAEKIYVPVSKKYPFTTTDVEYHPVDECNYYEELLVELLGEKGYEAQIVDIEIKDNFVIIGII